MRFLIIFVLISNFSFAQSSSELLSFASADSDTSFLPENEEHDFNFAAVHTKAAISQIQNQVAGLEYPESMFKHCIEGELIVEIAISNIGEIRYSKIIKSLWPEFDNLVLATMKEMGQIDFVGKEYQGGKRFKMPVNFSMR